MVVPNRTNDLIDEELPRVSEIDSDSPMTESKLAPRPTLIEPSTAENPAIEISEPRRVNAPTESSPQQRRRSATRTSPLREADDPKCVTPPTVRERPSLRKETTDTELTELKPPSMEKASPMKVCRAIEVALPNRAVESTDTALPFCDAPDTDNELPNLAKLRAERLLPKDKP
jgi:hypothetical protein